jgi:hypothetical protein
MDQSLGCIMKALCTKGLAPLQMYDFVKTSSAGLNLSHVLIKGHSPIVKISHQLISSHSRAEVAHVKVAGVCSYLILFLKFIASVIPTIECVLAQVLKTKFAVNSCLLFATCAFGATTRCGCVSPIV